jgi:hypothetical protein
MIKMSTIFAFPEPLLLFFGLFVLAIDDRMAAGAVVEDISSFLVDKSWQLAVREEARGRGQ